MASGSIRSAANLNDGGIGSSGSASIRSNRACRNTRKGSAVLGPFLFSGCHGHHFRGLVAGLGRQVREACVEIQRHPLTANADDDPMTFRIVRDQLRLACFFLNGYYFGCFGHDTEYADCALRKPVSTPYLYDHHQIIYLVSSPTPQPANLPLAETGAKRNGCAEAQVTSFPVASVVTSVVPTLCSLSWKA